MESFKIRVTPEQSKIVQEEMFKRGYEWTMSCKTIAHLEKPHLFFYDGGILVYSDVDDYFSAHNLPELTFEEFKTKYLNNMKEFKIEVPKGYEIDIEKSTFERIVFKRVKQPPQSFEELEGTVIGLTMKNYNRELAALSKLLKLRDSWNDGWTPDWTDGSPKWCIVNKSTALTVDYRAVIAHPISFKTKELAEQFFAAPKIRELLEIAKPLL